jgi:hypothetical protein
MNRSLGDNPVSTIIVWREKAKMVYSSRPTATGGICPQRFKNNAENASQAFGAETASLVQSSSVFLT